MRLKDSHDRWKRNKKLEVFGFPSYNEFRGNEKMTSLKEKAEQYIPSEKMKIISDMEKISVDVEIETETKTNRDGEEYSVNYFIYKDEKYRVPYTVLRDLKIQLEENPKLKFFKVKKTGTGIDSSYTVIPM